VIRRRGVPMPQGAAGMGFTMRGIESLKELIADQKL
jgi:hypothetical protein